MSMCSHSLLSLGLVGEVLGNESVRRYDCYLVVFGIVFELVLHFATEHSEKK